jgi:TonB family protein
LELLPRYPAAYKVKIYDALTMLYGSVGQTDKLKDVYEKVFDLDGASITARQVARDNLASLLLSSGMADKAAALYNIEDRPICPPMQLSTALTLGRIYIATQSLDKARAIVEQFGARASAELDESSDEWNDWMLFRFRVDCQSKDWDTCGADLEIFANAKFPQIPPVKSINVYLPALRQIPEMQAKLQDLTRRGVLDEHGFSSLRWKVDTEPMLESCPPAAYPIIARKERISGYVVVQAYFDETGKYLKGKIIAAQPQGYFETEALAVLQKCKVRPPTKDGIPGPSMGTRRINFKLSQQSK